MNNAGKRIKLLLYTLILLGFLSCKKDTPQEEIDEEHIKNYIKLNNIPAIRTPTGLYYYISDTTSNLKVTYGKTLDVRYTERILNDAIIFSNMTSNVQALFKLGNGDIIDGLEEGFLYLKKGERAHFFIPSHLAYGRQQYGAIPPNAILHFEVYIVEIQ